MSNLPNQADLENVFFYFSRVAEPVQKYQTEGDANKEYVTTVVISKEQYNQFIKEFPSKKTAPIENDDFKEKYKTDPPFPNQAMQYVLKFKQRAFKKDGTPMPDGLRPKVYQFINNEQVDITTTLIGNGSQGTLRYSVWTPTQMSGKEPPKPTANLFAMLITDLVEYEDKRVDPNKFNPV